MVRYLVERQLLRFTWTGLLLLATAGESAAQQTDIRQALSHFDKFELPAAESAFRAVAESLGDPKEQVEARAFLALIAWRYRHDWGTAERELRAALRMGVDSSKVFSWLSRMERKRGRHSQAVAAARQGLRTSSSTAEELKAAQMLGAAALASVETALWADPPRSLDSLSADWLREAHTHLTRLLPQNQGLLNLSRVALRVALLAGDGDAALDAWRSYYATLVDTREGRLLEEPGRVLAKQLPAWGKGPLSADLRASVTKAFADAAMFEEAAMTAWGFGSGGPSAAPAGTRIGDILAYARFLRDLRDTTNEYYRQTALGALGVEGDLDTLRARLDNLAADLWPRVHWPEGSPEYSLSAFSDEMETRFRAYLGFARSAGRFFALWYAHVLVDDSITVEQHGHTARLRFVALDGVISSGFSSWAWDHRSQTGGTANAERVLQFRPAYADGPVDAWWRLTDPDEREERLARERRETEGDWGRAQEDPYGYLPGLKLRLDRQGLEALRDSLEAEGLSGEELKARFLAAYREAVFRSSIVAHEGRHAIDRRLGLGDDPLLDKEFRAKLSEVAFAPHPRLAFGGILMGNIGGDSPHGQANSRIMRGLMAWMEEHREEIMGVDPTRPLLPQLDRLSDAQLGAAFLSMDPLAGAGQPGPS